MVDDHDDAVIVCAGTVAGVFLVSVDVREWSLQCTPSQFWQLEAISLVHCPDKSQLVVVVTCSGKLHIWALRSLRHSAAARPTWGTASHAGVITSVSFTHDLEFFVWATWTGTVEVFRRCDHPQTEWYWSRWWRGDLKATATNTSYIGKTVDEDTIEELMQIMSPDPSKASPTIDHPSPLDPPHVRSPPMRPRRAPTPLQDNALLPLGRLGSTADPPVVLSMSYEWSTDSTEEQATGHDARQAASTPRGTAWPLDAWYLNDPMTGNGVNAKGLTPGTLQAGLIAQWLPEHPRSRKPRAGSAAGDDSSHTSERRRLMLGGGVLRGLLLLELDSVALNEEISPSVESRVCDAATNDLGSPADRRSPAPLLSSAASPRAIPSKLPTMHTAELRIGQRVRQRSRQLNYPVSELRAYFAHYYHLPTTLAGLVQRPKPRCAHVMYGLHLDGAITPVVLPFAAACCHNKHDTCAMGWRRSCSGADVSPGLLEAVAMGIGALHAAKADDAQTLQLNSMVHRHAQARGSAEVTVLTGSESCGWTLPIDWVPTALLLAVLCPECLHTSGARSECDTEVASRAVVHREATTCIVLFVGTMADGRILLCRFSAGTGSCTLRLQFGADHGHTGIEVGVTPPPEWELDCDITCGAGEAAWLFAELGRLGL